MVKLQLMNCIWIIKNGIEQSYLEKFIYSKDRFCRVFVMSLVGLTEKLNLEEIRQNDILLIWSPKREFMTGMTPF